jgi:hypothetical protein
LLAINAGLEIGSELIMYVVVSSVKMERHGFMDAPPTSIMSPLIN